jgi:hypothetical protein
VAVVESSLRAATSIGYAHAPIVIALNEQMPSQNGSYRKFTICQYSDEFIRMSNVLAELNALEPGWGGSLTIIGSPQGDSSSEVVNGLGPKTGKSCNKSSPFSQWVL